MGMPFQFTHSGRGATCIGRAGRRCRCRFNSRTLGRVRLCSFILHFRPKLFQFTHPGKGATRGSIFSANSITVSIHAPWEGCDLVSTIRAMVDYCFNSRTLGRVRLNSEHRTNATSSFNSRTLGRVRRGRPGGVLLAQKVSIHAPWEGCDTFFPVSSLMLCCFNSRTLGRVRLFHQRTPKTAALCFNSRTLGRVRPRRHHQDRRADHVSIHAPWEGCD